MVDDAPFDMFDEADLEEMWRSLPARDASFDDFARAAIAFFERSMAREPDVDTRRLAEAFRTFGPDHPDAFDYLGTVGEQDVAGTPTQSRERGFGDDMRSGIMQAVSEFRLGDFFNPSTRPNALGPALDSSGRSDVITSDVMSSRFEGMEEFGFGNDCSLGCMYDPVDRHLRLIIRCIQLEPPATQLPFLAELVPPSGDPLRVVASGGRVMFDLKNAALDDIRDIVVRMPLPTDTGGA